jgi:hypothetical protein
VIVPQTLGGDRCLADKCLFILSAERYLSLSLTYFVKQTTIVWRLFYEMNGLAIMISLDTRMAPLCSLAELEYREPLYACRRLVAGQAPRLSCR